MAKMHGHYFGRGRKIMTRYFRRNASGLLLYFAYSIAEMMKQAGRKLVTSI